MPTYSDEINVYNPNAIDNAIGEARDYYVTSVTNDGIWVTPHDAKPVNGAATSTTRGWHIADALEYFRGTVRYIKAWLNGTVPTVRLGQDSSGHADVTPSGLEVFTDSSTSAASFGSTARIGKTNRSRALIGESSFEMANRLGTSYFQLRENPAVTATVKAFTSSYRVPSEIVQGSTFYVVIRCGFNAEQVDYTSFTHGTSRSTTAGDEGYVTVTYDASSGLIRVVESTPSYECEYIGIEYTASTSSVYAAFGSASKLATRGNFTFSCGEGLAASSDNQTAMGRFNVEDDSDDYALIVGNGTADDARSNALAVRWDGSIECASDTSWTTLNSTIKYRIHHGVCYVAGTSANVTQVATSGTVVGTLPTEARPTIDVQGAASTMGNNSGQWKVNTSGQITVWGFNSATKYWTFTASYPL